MLFIHSVHELCGVDGDVKTASAVATRGMFSFFLFYFNEDVSKNNCGLKSAAIHMIAYCTVCKLVFYGSKLKCLQSDFASLTL